jgi:hypothetical protein
MLSALKLRFQFAFPAILPKETPRITPQVLDPAGKETSPSIDLSHMQALLPSPRKLTDAHHSLASMIRAALILPSRFPAYLHYYDCIWLVDQPQYNGDVIQPDSPFSLNHPIWKYGRRLMNMPQSCSEQL